MRTERLPVFTKNSEVYLSFSEILTYNRDIYKIDKGA